MNDLLSRSSGMSYVNLRKDRVRDLEAGGETEMADMVHDDRSFLQFREEVGPVRQEMERVKMLLADLQRANEESKIITRAEAMKALRHRMDATIEQVLRSAKLIKAHLQALDQANLANRRIPGCEEGTSVDRMRMSVMVGLRYTLKSLMDEFQSVRQRMMVEYRETVERRYFTVTGKHADEETIDQMIDTGRSETFLQEAVQEQGRGQILETVREIQERHDAAKEIERSLLELHQVFLDMSVLVEAQGEQLNNIQHAVWHASHFVKKGTDDLRAAKEYQSSSRKWKCMAIIILLIVIMIVLVPILVKVIPSHS